MRVSPYVGDRATTRSRNPTNAGLIHKKASVGQGETEDADRNTTIFIPLREAPAQSREDTTGHGFERQSGVKLRSGSVEAELSTQKCLEGFMVESVVSEGIHFKPNNAGPNDSAKQQSSVNFISESRPKSTKPIKSSLKQGSAKPKGATRRRIRGLWIEGESDYFSLLRDSTLQEILSFLSVGEFVSLSAVSNRWRHLALHPSCWQHVDATDFISAAQRMLKGSAKDIIAKKTASALRNRLEKYSPESLTIHSIRDLLNPEDFLPSINGLKRLVLTRFLGLSDTHVHVMLLSASELEARARAKNSNSIRKLCLEYCPLVTNGSLRSIASQCGQLEELSLRGCTNISDVSALRSLFKIEKVDDAPSSTKVDKGGIQSLFAPPTQSATVQQPSPEQGLTSLFSPPPPSSSLRMNACTKTSQLSSMFEVPASTESCSSSNTSSNGLFSLFERPQDMATTALKKPQTQSTGMSSLFDPERTNQPAEEKAPDRSGLASLFEPPKTSGPKQSGLASLFEPPKPSVSIATNKTQLGGSLTRLDFSYTSLTASALAHVVESLPGTIVLDSLKMRGSGESWTDATIAKLSSCDWQGLDICCADFKAGSVRLTDDGFGALKLGQCEELSISGQQGVHITSLTRTLNAAKKLRSLEAECCSSLFKGDEASTAKMLSSVQNSPSLEFVNVAGCFSGEATGKRFLDAICNSASRLTLKELDLRFCWFVTASEVAKVRRACPKLQRIHLLGTRCNEVI